MELFCSNDIYGEDMRIRFSRHFRHVRFTGSVTSIYLTFKSHWKIDRMIRPQQINKGYFAFFPMLACFYKVKFLIFRERSLYY